MKNIFFSFFLLIISLTGLSQVNYLDSIAKEMEKVNLEQQIEIVLDIPYDKIVARTDLAETIFLNLAEKKQKFNR